MDDRPKDGGPAFPLQGLGMDGLPSHAPDFGMSLREFFAAAALTGILARFPPDPKEAAKAAYQYADAMIARGGE